MCGRYAMSMDTVQLQQAVQRYNLPVDKVLGESNQHPSYNVCPTRYAPTYHYQSNELVLEYASWGLIPFWVKRAADANQYTTFNARKESIIEGKRIWKPVRSHRCVVPIEGYYEWLSKPIGSSKKMEKIPYYVRRKDKKLMFLAGLYTTVEFEDTKEKVHSFTVITGPAPKGLEWLHSRMPVVLEPKTKEWETWLDNGGWDKNVESCLGSYNKDTLEWFEVTKDVGKVNNEGEYLIKPLEKGKVGDFFGSGKNKELKKEQVKREDDNVSVERSLNDDTKVPKKEQDKVGNPDIKKETKDIKSFFSPRKRNEDSISERIEKEHKKLKK